ncbi:MAG: hypothetical protein ACFFCQ_02805 [Promethearchaeota archaeon]
MSKRKGKRKPKKKCPECGKEVAVRKIWGSKKALLHCVFCPWQKWRKEDEYPTEEDMAEPW